MALRDVRDLFPLIIETAEGFRTNCPRCEDQERKLYFNIAKGVGCCHHALCAWNPGQGGVTERRLRAFFSARGVEFQVPEIVRSAPEADLQLPKEFQLLEDLPKDLAEDIFAYLSFRGLTRKVLRAARIGYCQKGKFWGYLIFPVFDEDGQVVYWQGRRYKQRTPKFYNPKSSHKSELVYRVGSSRKPHQIVLVESILNALTLYHAGIRTTLILGLLGKAMSESQRDQVLVYEHWLQEVIVALDPDANRQAVEIAAQLVVPVPIVRIARFPEGEDINSLGRERAWDRISNAPVFHSQERIKFLVGAS